MYNKSKIPVAIINLIIKVYFSVPLEFSAVGDKWFPEGGSVPNRTHWLRVLPLYCSVHIYVINTYKQMRKKTKHHMGYFIELIWNWPLQLQWDFIFRGEWLPLSLREEKISHLSVSPKGKVRTQHLCSFAISAPHIISPYKCKLLVLLEPRSNAHPI